MLISIHVDKLFLYDLRSPFLNVNFCHFWFVKTERANDYMTKKLKTSEKITLKANVTSLMTTESDTVSWNKNILSSEKNTIRDLGLYTKS